MKQEPFVTLRLGTLICGRICNCCQPWPYRPVSTAANGNKRGSGHRRCWWFPIQWSRRPIQLRRCCQRRLNRSVGCSQWRRLMWRASAGRCRCPVSRYCSRDGWWSGTHGETPHRYSVPVGRAVPGTRRPPMCWFWGKRHNWVKWLHSCWWHQGSWENTRRWGEFFLSLSSLFSSWLLGGGAYLPPTRGKSREGVRTHPWKQWAAVRIHWLLIRVPPQECLPLLCRLACQGQAPAGASSPPTILVLRGAMPQTGPKKDKLVASRRGSPLKPEVWSSIR